MSDSQWRRVSHQAPCPICGKPDWCTVTADGGAVICGRIEAGAVKETGGGWLHILRDNPDWQGLNWSQRNFTPLKSAAPKRKLPARDWGKLAADYFAAADSQRETLARNLGVCPQALQRLQVGWDRWDKCWTIPERDQSGNVIGISRRFPDGDKGFHKGGQRGLTYPDGWQDTPGPVLLVEGASDVAACLTLELCAIGRPSNRGGVDYLRGLLCDLPADRQIVVVAEHDEKPDGRCPGREGAISTAEKLSKELLREVGWTFPPDDRKDARAWLNHAKQSRN